MSRLTRVQRDVIDRLRDGWKLHRSPAGAWGEFKQGEASRYLNPRTARALELRGLIVPMYPGEIVWTLSAQDRAS